MEPHAYVGGKYFIFRFACGKRCRYQALRLGEDSCIFFCPRCPQEWQDSKTLRLCALILMKQNKKAMGMLICATVQVLGNQYLSHPHGSIQSAKESRKVAEGSIEMLRYFLEYSSFFPKVYTLIQSPRLRVYVRQQAHPQGGIDALRLLRKKQGGRR